MSSFRLVIVLSLACAVVGGGPALGQSADRPANAEATAEGAADTTARDASRNGFVVDVPLPLEADTADRLLATLQGLADRPQQAGRRGIVVLRFPAKGSSNDGRGTRFEDALLLARAISSNQLRSLRIVAMVTGPVRGHATLVVLACDQLLVTDQARLGDASVDETEPDAGVEQMYLAITSRRGVFPEALVRGMLNPSLELAQITQVDGTVQFAVGESLQEIRDKGEAWRENQLAASGETALLDGNLLRETRLASHLVRDIDQAADVLDLAKLISADAGERVKVETGTLVEIIGNIRGDRIRRLESNLAASYDAEQTDAWLFSIDSSGGSLSNSVRLAGTIAAADGRSFADAGQADAGMVGRAPGTGRSLQRVAGWVETEALGDAALIALACRPLYLSPDAKIGGPGAQHIRPEDARALREAIEQIAIDSGRPASLLQALVDPSLQVYRYDDRRTGRVRYATEEELTLEMEAEGNIDAMERWERGEAIDLQKGLSAAEAIRLGLAEGERTSLQDVAREIGLDEIPPALTDRPIVRTVEWLGGLPLLATALLLIGFMTLSMEMSAPGLGIPGFISMLCFALFFWTRFLSGTAEWLEVVVFGLGIVCIMIEIFVLPGFGVFGVGGLLLIVAGIVLTSQTFVIPRNPYQYAQMTRSLGNVLIASGGLAAGFVLLRWLVPNTPLFRHLRLEQPDLAVLEQREQIARYDHLMGQVGNAVTSLRPSGKARFGSDLVAVVSDGSPISDGESIRVIEVRGNHVVVEAIDDSS